MEIEDSDKLTDKGEKPLKLLLHMCCGPCAAWPLMKLKQTDGIELAAVFYNPNIHPRDEFEKRKAGAIAVTDLQSVVLSVYDDCEQSVWENFETARRLDSSADDLSRCRMCYDRRLDFVAKKAKEEGFDAFSTTLLISPYQQHDMIKELGEFYQSKYGVKFYYEDFRLFFREGQRMAREMGIYRQKYCGCIVSAGLLQDN